MKPSRAAAAQARRMLAGRGLHPWPHSVYAARAPGNYSYPKPDEIEAYLMGVAAHIGSNDPVEIGAGALLESMGFERAPPVQTTLWD